MGQNAFQVAGFRPLVGQFHEPIPKISERQEDLSISVITVAELYAGVREGAERAKLDMFLLAFVVIPLDSEIAVRGGLIRREYGKSHSTGLADALIAATVLVRQLRLIGLNRKHFPMLPDMLTPY